MYGFLCIIYTDIKLTRLYELTINIKNYIDKYFLLLPVWYCIPMNMVLLHTDQWSTTASEPEDLELQANE